MSTISSRHLSAVAFQGSWRISKESFYKTWDEESAEEVMAVYQDVFKRHAPKIADLPFSVELIASACSIPGWIPFTREKSEVIFVAAKGRQRKEELFEGIYRKFLESRPDFIKRVIREARLLAKKIDAR